MQNKSSQRSQTSAKENYGPDPEFVSGLITPNSGSGLPPNLMRTSLSTYTSVIEFSWQSDHSLRRYNPNCRKMLYLAILKNSSKIFWIRIRSRMTSKLYSVFPSWRSVSFYIKLLIDRQTNAMHYTTSLAGIIKTLKRMGRREREF